MSKILLTCGIGDFVALTSFIPEQEFNDVDTILWASRQRKTIQQSFNLQQMFPQLQNQIIVHDTWCTHEVWDAKGRTINDSTPYCLGNKHDLIKVGVDPRRQFQIELAEISDWSMTEIIYRAAQRQYITIDAKRAVNALHCENISVKLPERYIVVQSYSSNAFHNFRDFNNNDWSQIIAFAKNNNLPIVVLGTDKAKAIVKTPIHSLITDLTDQTTFVQATEITQKCTKFIGCASALSVIAAKTLPIADVLIKGRTYLSTESRFYTNAPRRIGRWMPWRFYYSPFDRNIFLFDRLVVNNNPVEVVDNRPFIAR